MNNITVIKVGGSRLSPTNDTPFDFEWAQNFRDLLAPYISLGKKFILITGGGFIARKYQGLLDENGYAEYDKHYVGTAICNVNATLLRAVFGDIAEAGIVAFNDYDELNRISLKRSVLIGGGSKPGPSSDFDAALLAKHFGSTGILSMKDVAGVYSSDPDKDANATMLHSLAWEEYQKIIGATLLHSPGGNLPVDPIASKYCNENNLSFYIFDGKNSEALKKALDGDYSIGSLISN